MATLTETERSTVVNSLRVAADRFDEDAKAVKETNFSRLAEQFKRQAAESRSLANKFENEEV